MNEEVRKTENYREEIRRDLRNFPSFVRPCFPIFICLPSWFQGFLIKNFFIREYALAYVLDFRCL